jgi:hypothetical protein
MQSDVSLADIQPYFSALDQLSPSAMQAKQQRIQHDTPHLLATLSASVAETPFMTVDELEHAFWSNKKTVADIAVCVSGQVARWQPYHLVQSLLQANPRYRFHFFFNIQASVNRTTMTKNINNNNNNKNNGADTNNIVYNTDTMNVFDPGYMTFLTYDETWVFLQSLLQTKHSKVASLVFSDPLTAKEWKTYFQTDNLDRITQYKDAQATILNMYAHQPRCIEQILQYEAQQQATQKSNKQQQPQQHNHHQPFRFDYVVSTREDVYFFKPMNLTHIIHKLHHGQKNEYLPEHPTPAQEQELAYLSKCDVPYKRCLSFWGFNMRFFILTRDKGIPFFGNRLSFYQFLLQINKTVDNPERFELSMANALQLTPCPMSVEEYPVTAARYFQQGQFCFIAFEIQQCVPQDNLDFIRQHLCTDFRRRMYLQYMYTDAKVRLKHNFTLASSNVHSYFYPKDGDGSSHPLPQDSSTNVNKNPHPAGTTSNDEVGGSSGSSSSSSSSNHHSGYKNRHRVRNNLAWTSSSGAGLSYHYQLNLTEFFKPLKGADLKRHVEIVHPFHSMNATFNMEVVQKVPKATGMYLARDIPFIQRSWKPLYPFPPGTAMMVTTDEKEKNKNKEKKTNSAPM